MRIVIQRVLQANVCVEGQTVGEIGPGLLVLVGVGHDDNRQDALWLANKTVDLRIFEDDDGKMNRSLRDVQGEALIISQFTLLADCRKGRRPAFTDAAPPDLARRIYEQYADQVAATGIHVQRGIFAADMQVSLINDGPVTIIIDRPDS